MLDLGQDADLTVGSLGVSRVLEGIKYLLQSVLSLRAFVDDLPNVAVRPASQQFFRLVKLKNMVVDFLAHYFSNGNSPKCYYFL